VLVRLYNVLAILAIAHLLALGALVGALISSGRLTPERAREIVKMLRTQPDESQEEEAGSEEQAVASEDETAGEAPSIEQLQQRRQQERLQSAALERARRDLVAQQELVQQLLHDLLQRQEEFDRARKAWIEQKNRQLNEARDVGFQRELEYFSKLPPKQAKEILVRKWKKSPADAVRILAAGKTSVGRAVLGQMKTPEEVGILYELLEQLGQQDIDRLVPGSGRTTGGAP